MSHPFKYVKLYALDYARALPLVPGSMYREWIDKTEGTPYYYDLVGTMACQSGWEFKSPGDFTIEWNGGPKTDDTCVHSYVSDAHLFHTAMGNGICSIKTNYIVETSSNYGTLIMGAPNFFKDGAVQMCALMETNWSHIPITLNWKMIKPGKVDFKKGEPLGFMTIVPHKQLDDFNISIESIFDNPELYTRYLSWEKTTDDPYKKGIINSDTGEKTTEFHINKRKLMKPQKKFTKVKKSDTVEETTNKEEHNV